MLRTMLFVFSPFSTAAFIYPHKKSFLNPKRSLVGLFRFLGCLEGRGCVLKNTDWWNTHHTALSFVHALWSVFAEEQMIL